MKTIVCAALTASILAFSLDTLKRVEHDRLEHALVVEQLRHELQVREIDARRDPPPPVTDHLRFDPAAGVWIAPAVGASGGITLVGGPSDGRSR